MLKRLLLALLFLAAAPAHAQPAAPAPAQQASPQFRAAAERVVGLLRGQVQPAALFDAASRARVPDAQIAAIVQKFTSQYGAVQGLERIEPASAQAGTIHIRFARAL